MTAFRSAVVALLLAAPATAAPVPGDKTDFLKVELPIPKDALAVAHVNGVGVAKEHFAKFLATALPDQAAKRTKDAEAALAAALDDRDLSALKSDRRVYLVLFEAADLVGPDQGAPPTVMVLPTDAKTFRDKLLTADERKGYDKGKAGIDTFEVGNETHFLIEMAERGYVAVTPSKELAERFAKKFEPLTGAAIGDPVVGAFLGCDASVYVNLDAVNDKYGDQIRGFRGVMEGLLQMGGGLVPGLDKAQLEAAKTAALGLFQAVEDGKGFALGVEFRPDAVLVRAEVAFRPDTPSGKFLAAEAPSPLEKLNDLPKGHATYSAAKVGAGVVKAVSAFAREFAADDAEATTAADAYAELVAAAWAEGTVAVGSGVNAGLEVSFPKDAAKLTAAHAKALKALPAAGRFQNIPLKEKPALKEGDQSHLGFTLHRATVVVDFEAAVAQLPDENLKKSALESMKSMLAERTTYWFGHDGRRFVRVTAPDWAAAKKLLDEYVEAKDKAGADPAFAAARKHLPAEASHVYVAEVGQALTSGGGFLKSMMDAMPGFPGGDVPALKPVAGAKPAYAAVATVLKPGSVGFTVAVPAGAAKVAYGILEPALKKAD